MTDADRQIQQMIAFIKQEAKEKAEEILVKTESEFMAEKMQIQSQSSISIREEFEKKKKDRITERKIQRSQQLSEARFATMRRRDDKVKALKKEIYGKLALVAEEKRDQYPELICSLLVQGLLTISEEDVTVICRKEDVKIVQAQIEPAVKKLKELIIEATKEDIEGGVRPAVSVKLSTTEFLPPAPSKDNPGASCCGGVKLSARGGKIVCKNTLDARFEIAFRQLQPQVRAILFGIRPIANKGTPTPAAHH